MSTDKMFAAKSAINELASSTRSAVNKLNDPLKQLGDSAVIINNFVLQTLAAVDGNDDIASVNELLTNSLVQIRQFAQERPVTLQQAIATESERLSAYEQCLVVLDEIDKLDFEPVSVDNDIANNDIINGIIDELDSDGNYTKAREIGSRPEKLKDIRAAEEKVRASDNSPE